jgi:hypothetical protein
MNNTHTLRRSALSTVPPVHSSVNQRHSAAFNLPCALVCSRLQRAQQTPTRPQYHCVLACHLLASDNNLMGKGEFNMAANLHWFKIHPALKRNLNLHHYQAIFIDSIYNSASLLVCDDISIYHAGIYNPNKKYFVHLWKSESLKLQPIPHWAQGVKFFACWKHQQNLISL